MSATNSDPRVQSSELGALLRSWRETRGVSQLDLSLDAGISQRQISFIESGRSVPGRQALLNIAQLLDVPLSERNALLLSSGYAPIYPEAAWNAQEMSSVTNVLRRMLRQQEPFPAVIMDRYRNVLMANQAFDRFFDVQACTEPRNRAMPTPERPTDDACERWVVAELARAHVTVWIAASPSKRISDRVIRWPWSAHLLRRNADCQGVRPAVPHILKTSTRAAARS